MPAGLPRFCEATALIDISSRLHEVTITLTDVDKSEQEVAPAGEIPIDFSATRS